jgi:rubrerythrin
LLKKHPYLLPRNDFTDEVTEDYDYSYTILDEMPDGWKKAFGEQMCDEITTVLKKYNYLDEYRVVQVKEKYARLCWFDNGVPKECWDRFYAIIDKYEDMSERTCVVCGKTATKMSRGWICPYCDDCAKKLEGRVKFVEINDNEKKELD